MFLADLNLTVEEAEPPRDIRTFLREANRRVRSFLREGRLPAFVPSDYRQAYLTLRAIAREGLAPGNLFSEWGSGFGVVTCLACLLEFDAFGIEVEGELVEHARRLADDFDLPVTYLQGSFLPRHGPARPDPRDFAWLSTETAAHEDWDLGPDEADVVFAYPWPDEEILTADVFRRHSRPRALLVTYHDTGNLRVRRNAQRC